MTSNFAAFLNEVNSKCKLITFKGNRFNVVFWNGAATYYHKPNFDQFFFSIHGTPNRLLRAVHEDLGDVVHLAGCRTLGIIDMLITGPFWCMLENDEPYISLNEHFHHMQIKFQEWAEDARTRRYFFPPYRFINTVCTMPCSRKVTTPFLIP